MGPPDFLINNAGVINTPAPLWKVSADEMAKVVSVNILGVANVIRAFAPAMVERGNGVIVNPELGLGQGRGAGGCPLLRDQVGDRRTSPRRSPRSLAQGDGGRRAQSRCHRHGHAARLFLGRRCVLSQGGCTGAKSAAPFIPGLRPSDNGRSATVGVIRGLRPPRQAIGMCGSTSAS